LCICSVHLDICNVYAAINTAFISDNIISVHDMTAVNFPTVTVVQRTRGATLFTLDIKVSSNSKMSFILLSAYCPHRKRVIW
jgi:hypothetical protein